MRKLPANVGAWCIVRIGEGIGPHGHILPRGHCRYLAGEVGQIKERFAKGDKYDVRVRLPEHPDAPGVERDFLFRRAEIHVLPCGPEYLTAKMVAPMEWWPTDEELIQR